jgi:homoserine O-acetyltransferase
VRDQVAAEVLLADHLGIGAWHLVVGGSMGGMRAVEWAATHPARVERLLAVATGARATADQIAWWSAESAAVRADPGWRGGDYHDAAPGEGPHTGLGQARRIAHLTYRTALELELRFGREPQQGEDPLDGGRFAVESYLDHAAAKLVRRFDAGSYVALSGSMQTHDAGRGRGGVARALGAVTAAARVVAVDSDRLFPPHLSHELAEHLPGAAGVDVVTSPYGHDAFLLETGAVGRVARELLATAVPPAATAAERTAPPGLVGACAGAGEQRA